ncbi:accessory gland protein Acp29AB-like [Drosophila kikkawai]|uniref:Accessory gland protein Acp29AB-like n=1 Tax=Drosophila kikkawai TaxID=30033 RepID=A0ABM4G9J5_DROKI
MVYDWSCCYRRFSKDFKKIGSKYYYIEDNDELDWFDASDKCESMNAHLVSIKNVNEWAAINNHLTQCKDYWVDIRNDGDEFVSEATGEEAPFLKWAPGQPNKQQNYDCVKLQKGCHCMKTKYCSQKNYFICEANMTPTKPYEILDLRYKN